MKKKVKSIRKAYKSYGSNTGYLYLTLICSYRECVRKIEERHHDYELPAFKERFKKYVRKGYGNDFLESFSAFYRENKENKKLLKALEKRKQDFLDRDILLLLEKDKPKICTHTKSKINMQGKSEYAQEIAQMTTAQHVFNNGPSRNINYLPYSPSKSVSIPYKFTLKRYGSGEVFTTYRQGKDIEEAMTIVNRLYFDSARIISVEEEKTGKKVL